MKSINTKRIAAVAASLLMGLAFAGTGGVTWSNIPIINNQGQPVVQVVVGSAAQPSDGVVAANIAAVLGNLAFTSENVTATATGLSGVNCVVTTPTCTLSNQQVWFGVKGFSGPSGSFAFAALIGSVLNQGVVLGSPVNTKATSSSSAYAFPATGNNQVNVQASPASSPFATLSSPPNPSTPISISTGGGITFGTLRNGGFDNVLQVTSSQLPALLNNWGANGESETLWLSGYPVYDPKGSTNPAAPGFVIFNVGGAYQVSFSKPVQEPLILSGNSVNNAGVILLGKNWTILNYTLPGGAPTGANLAGQKVVNSGNALVGGTLSLAASLSSLQTVYVGHNITSGQFAVQLTDLGQPNSSGISQASVEVFYNGTLSNVTQLYPGTTTKFKVAGHSVFVQVNQTFAGLYAYQKWAKIKLYSNVLNITGSGQVVNQTNAPGWRALILWSNTSGTGKTNQLQSIIFYNATPTTLTPGGSFNFVSPNMTAWKVNFVGDTIGTNVDPVQFSTSAVNSGTQFLNPTPGAVGSTSLTYISEPYQQLTVSSTLPNAFTYGGPVSSTITYDLTPYQLNFVSNTLHLSAGGASGLPVNVIVSSLVGDANVIQSLSSITLNLQGYATSTSPTVTSASVTIPGPLTIPGAANTIGPGSTSLWAGQTSFYNITNVTLGTALPYLEVNVIATGTAGALSSLAILQPYQSATNGGPQVMYKTSGNNYFQLTSSDAVTYQQPGGSPTGGFNLFQAGVYPGGVTPIVGQVNPYYVFGVTEYNVPGQTTNDILQIGVYNNTNGAGSNFGFELNKTAIATRNNLTYISSQGNPVAAPVGFVTERGSKVASISPSSVTIDMAKAVDTLQFIVAPFSTSLSNASTTSKVGPVGVGQAVPGFANLTVAAVNATCSGGSAASSACTVTGLANVTATPSVTQAVVPLKLNTATTPLVVLDSNANSAATLVLVGSKYVNSVSAQVFAQNPSLNSSFGPGSVVVQAYGTNRILVAGYTANQTVTAGNQFINDLLGAASTV